MKKSDIADVIIIGAGASGLMCALEASRRGKKVLILDHNKIAGAKILVSGGGKCNFTNRNIDPENYISNNPHFVKSALARFSQHDFISIIENNGIKYEERSHGQLFLKKRANEISDLFLRELKKYNSKLLLETRVVAVEKNKGIFIVKSDQGSFKSKSVVVSSGGLAAPQTGASPIGYEIAEHFKIKIIKPFPGLVPLTFSAEDRKKFTNLSGIAVNSVVKNSKISFKENILFTHKGLSGPAALQISLYLKPGESVFIDLLPEKRIENEIKKHKQSKKLVKNFVSTLLPKNLCEAVLQKNIADRTLKSLTEQEISTIAETLHSLEVKPAGNLGFKKAETTLGGVDCNEVSSKTMESLKVEGLYFTGEVLDVAGWLGGYNLQWAWSSGWCAGQSV
jgi:predicted Rossmann fold flavoprotein